MFQLKKSASVCPTICKPFKIVQYRAQLRKITMKNISITSQSYLSNMINIILAKNYYHDTLLFSIVVSYKPIPLNYFSYLISQSFSYETIERGVENSNTGTMTEYNFRHSEFLNIKTEPERTNTLTIEQFAAFINCLFFTMLCFKYFRRYLFLLSKAHINLQMHIYPLLFSRKI